MTVVQTDPVVDGLPEGFDAFDLLIYGDDTTSIPEDAEALQRTFSGANPWFSVPEHEATCLLVEGQGRVAVFRPGALEIDGERAGFFGYWEATEGSDDAQRALFERAQQWAGARDIDVLYGPVNFNTYGAYRLRTHAEAGAGTFVGEPYNPSYYGALLERVGGVKDRGYVTQFSDHRTLHDVVVTKSAFIDALTDRGFKIDSMRHEDWLDNLKAIHDMIDAIFGNNFAYTPLTFETFKRACGHSFIRKADPETSVKIMAPDGRLAGFFLVYPDYSPLVVRGAGAERVPVSELDFHKHAAKAWSKGSHTAIFKTVGVHPDFRRLGIMGALSSSMVLKTRPEYTRLLGALIRDDNPSREYARNALLFEREYHLYRFEVS